MVEVAAVRANFEEWSRRGKALLHQQAKAAYEKECRSFANWEKDNPQAKGWRDQPATRAQWMLIRRTADRLDIAEVPMRLKRGEAHDWLQLHNANLRFRSTDGDGGPDIQAEVESKAADDNREAEA